jgi:hypothetical protein
LKVPEDVAARMNESLLKKSLDLGWNLSRFDKTAATSPAIAFDEWDIRAMLSYLRPASELISARDYWESRFEREPELRPRHVVYYEGDPTKAVEGFLARHGIVPGGDVIDYSSYPRRVELTHEERVLGFAEHFVADMSTDPRANRGLDEVTRLGHELLDELWERNSEGQSEGLVGDL